MEKTILLERFLWLSSQAKHPHLTLHATPMAKRVPDSTFRSNSLHVTATGSGHEIHLYQPSLVAETLVRAISAIRKHTTLSQP